MAERRPPPRLHVLASSRVLDPGATVCPHCRNPLPEAAPFDVWVERELPGPWRAAFRIFLQEGRAVVGEVRVIPRESRARPGQWSPEWSAWEHSLRARVPSGGLTTSTLRHALVPEAVQVVTAQLRSPAFLRKLRDFFGDDVLHALGLLDVREARAHRGGRPPDFSDQESAQWADRYVRLVEAGERHPIAALATMELPATRVREIIRGLRDRGFLTAGTRGRAGGQLTAKSRALLRERGGRTG